MSRRAARRRLTLLATATLALLATVAIAAEAASADTQTVGLGGWQVQSSAQATQSPAADLDAGLPDRRRGCTSGPTTPARSAPRSARSCRPAIARTCSSRPT